jgi:hypothetical protein
LIAESLTQDSRSAVKARLFDPCVDHSWKALHLPAAGVAASKEAVTNFQALDHAEHRRLHSATTVIRAYVTSGSPLVTTRVPNGVRTRYGLTPRRVASSRLAAHERRKALAQHAPRRRRSPGRARGWPAAPALFRRRHRPGLCNRLDGGRRWSTHGFRTSKPSTDSATATMGLHRDVPIPHTALDRYVALGALAPTIGATRRRCSIS